MNNDDLPHTYWKKSLLAPICIFFNFVCAFDVFYMYNHHLFITIIITRTLYKCIFNTNTCKDVT